MDDLTKDGQYLLGKIYEDYLLNINNGISKNQAKQLGSSHEINDNLVPNELFEDVDETMRELHRAEYIDAFYADDTVFQAILSDKSIIIMENRFGNNVKKLIDFLLKLK